MEMQSQSHQTRTDKTLKQINAKQKQQWYGQLTNKFQV